MTWKDSGTDVDDDDDDGLAYVLFLLKLLLGLYEKVGWPGLPRSQLFDPRSLQACLSASSYKMQQTFYFLRGNKVWAGLAVKGGQRG